MQIKKKKKIPLQLTATREGWKAYMRYSVSLAGLALACLYMTVLGFDNITVGRCSSCAPYVQEVKGVCKVLCVSIHQRLRHPFTQNQTNKQQQQQQNPNKQTNKQTTTKNEAKNKRRNEQIKTRVLCLQLTQSYRSSCRTSRVSYCRYMDVRNV